ncbi:hypothetical protein O181_015472 [Austropuccinia psidii MF-1]|uniref:Uncharacterized protein n=1 Tax=Austropuccinia psidii MF-1 TaxID=1389203 RepID=A0A9Q3C3R7_9BASI|nr:hypothetical protein [Austropuccinia psidii MF-1]
MSPVHLRDLGFQKRQPGDTEALARTRRPGRGHLGHSGGWQDIEGNHTNSAITIPIQQKPKTRGLEGYGSSSSAPPTPQRSFPMEHGQQFLQAHKDYTKPSLQWLHTIQEPTDQWPRLTTLHNPRKFPGEDKDTRAKKDFFEPKAETVRPNDPGAVGFGERSAQEPEVVVNKSRISSPINRNITPTQIEHNFVTPESSLKSDGLWLKISQFAEKTQKKFAELEESHERTKTSTASMDKIVKTVQEGHAQLSKDSEETNKRLNLVFEAQHHSKRNSDFMDQDIK